MKIEVLGPGCYNCHLVEQAAREAVTMAGVQAEIVKVTDYATIAGYGVMHTPGLVIDGAGSSAPGGSRAPATSPAGSPGKSLLTPRPGPRSHGARASTLGEHLRWRTNQIRVTAGQPLR